MFGFDAHFWEQLMLGSLTVVGAAGVAVAVFTYAVVVAQRAENAPTKLEFERYKIGVAENIVLSNERLKVAESEGKLAQEQAAIANKAAAEANERAANATLELEKFRTPRAISKEASARFVEQTKEFAGVKFAIAVASQLGEIQNFALQIEATLKLAGWIPVDWHGGDMVLTRPVGVAFGLASANGVVIEVHESQKDRLLPVAMSLAKSLQGEGISVEITVARLSNPDLIDVVKIIVGAKR